MNRRIRKIGPALPLITWGTYTNQLFHINDTGCFRCHDDTHSAKGDPEKKVRQDCELCHKEQVPALSR